MDFGCALRAPRNDGGGARRTFSFSRRNDARGIQSRDAQISEGAGKAGSSPLPWPACRKKARGRTTGSAKTSRPSLRDGLTVYSRSPRGPACLPPLSRDANASRVRDNACALRGCTTLARRHGISTGMPGPHGFTVRITSFVGTQNARCDVSRPTAPRLACRDDRETPLMPRRDAHRETQLPKKRNKNVLRPAP